MPVPSLVSGQILRAANPTRCLPPVITTPTTEIFNCIHRSVVKRLARILGKAVGLPQTSRTGFCSGSTFPQGRPCWMLLVEQEARRCEIAASTGCSVVGIRVHEQAVTTASSLAGQRGLTERAEFRSTDATGPLPFSVLLRRATKRKVWQKRRKAT
jgi:hypothetical protein